LDVEVAGVRSLFVDALDDWDAIVASLKRGRWRDYNG
jgi:hypothetical protein